MISLKAVLMALPGSLPGAHAHGARKEPPRASDRYPALHPTAKGSEENPPALWAHRTHPAGWTRPQPEGPRADEPVRLIVPALHGRARLRTQERPEQPGAAALKRAVQPAAQHARLPMPRLVYP